MCNWDKVREFWSSFIPPSNWEKIFTLGMHDWLHFDLAIQDVHTNSVACVTP